MLNTRAIICKQTPYIHTYLFLRSQRRVQLPNCTAETASEAKLKLLRSFVCFRDDKQYFDCNVSRQNNVK